MNRDELKREVGTIIDEIPYIDFVTRLDSKRKMFNVINQLEEPTLSTEQVDTVINQILKGTDWLRRMKLQDIIQRMENMDEHARNEWLERLNKEFAEEEPLYYARVKNLPEKTDIKYSYYNMYNGNNILIHTKLESPGHKTKFTKPQWNEFDVNDSNAIFEKVEDD